MKHFSALALLKPVAILSSLAVSMGLHPVQAQVIDLAKCDGLWFSTEEDFIATKQDIPGGQVVSDGDLLMLDLGTGMSRLCARNEDLLQRFDIQEFDHGLDALDRIDIDQSAVIAAFSTELDSMHTQFTAGDLLFTNGIIVPNAALLASFNMPRNFNLGLDGVEIEGSPAAQRELLAKLEGVSREQFIQSPGLLTEILRGTDTDILFSTEGTPPTVQKPQFLDGDLLSAKLGTIVRSNENLLPALPAGIPTKGVDYGLDAYTPAIDPMTLKPMELFSVEIQAGKATFSDGDILTTGPNLFMRNADLLSSFAPLDTDMGLDALAAPVGRTTCLSRITTISDIDVIDIDPVSGLFGIGTDPVDRPFGRWIRIQGVVPNANCPEYLTHEFQVRVSVDGGPEVPILHPLGLGWQRNVFPCIASNSPYSSDPSGWFALTNYWRFNECPDDGSLAFWSSLTAPGADVAVFRLVLRPIGGGAETFSAPVKIRLDNEAPTDMLAELYSVGAADPFGDQCEVDFGGADVVMDIKGRVRDEHFSHYDLYWTGGDVHVWQSVPVTVSRTYNSRPDLSDTGTEPPAATDVPFGTLNLTAQYALATGGELPIECGYTVMLRGTDRSHLGAFGPATNSFSHVGSNFADYMQSFCLHP